jgi:HSP20 family protein
MMGREIRVDIHETDNEIVLEAELPGFNKEDIEITLDDNSLTLKANQKMESEIRRDNYLRRERHSGSLVRSFLLPTEVDENQVKTSFNNGLLELRLRKKEPTKTRRRRINID